VGFSFETADVDFSTGRIAVKIRHTTKTFTIGENQFQMRRTREGVVEMWGANDFALATALGFAHGLDRMLQLMLVRLVGQGRLTACLKNNPENLEWDRQFRELRLSADAQEDVQNLSEGAHRLVSSYCAGLNYRLKNHGAPWEFRLTGYSPEPWTAADCLLTLKVVAYVALGESQGAMEKLIARSIHSGVNLRHLRKIFSPHLDGLSDDMAGTIKKTWIKPNQGPPRQSGIKCSNNWVVSGSRTASGLPLECHDPHMGPHQLPAFWYEFIQHTPGDFRIGVSIPGMPGMPMGRTTNVSYGFTFGFMDMLDYFVEEVRAGRCRRGSEFADLKVHQDVISPKAAAPVTVKIWESDVGVLEVPEGTDVIQDGYYLCRAWSGERLATAKSFNALQKTVSANTVCELQQILAEATLSCNFLMADRQGNIGYQQSGRLPLRQHSGLFPVPAWDASYHWKGYAAGDQLSRTTNPPDGILATANNDLNQEGKPLSINLPMGEERADRIRQLLEPMKTCTVEDMKKIQCDRYSLQAERYMTRLRPLIPECPSGKLLREWDCRYTKDSRAACLFEEIYSALLQEVFGQGLFGAEAWRDEIAESGILVDYYHFFDRALLGDDSSWWGTNGREALLRRVVDRVLLQFPARDAVPTWGSKRQIVMTNLFFGGILPRFLGFDYGPVALEGNRSTIVQGAIYKSKGRTTTFAPSYRFITNLAETQAHTTLAGGPSDRRFSKWYTTGIPRWLGYEYKVLEGRD
jgi:penicillin amidase